MKKVICTLLAALLMIGTVTGCASQEQNNSETASVSGENSENSGSESGTEEPVVISWIGTQDASYLDTAFPEDRVIKALEEKTGVRIDWGPNVGVSDINAKIAVLLAGGDLPDVVMPVNNEELGKNMIAAKAVIPLDDLVEEYGPNITKNCSKMIAANKLSRSDSSNALYAISMGVNGSDMGAKNVDTAWTIRWDLYKELGYPEITNYDEFLEVLKDMQELEPTNADGKKTYGLGLFLAESWGACMIDRAMMFEEGYSNLTDKEAVMVNTKTYTVEPRLTNADSPFWRSMEFYNKAYNEGVLDPESATLQYQPYLDKAGTNRYFAAGNGWAMSVSNQNLRAESQGEKGFMPILIDPNPEGIWAITEYQVGSQASAYISTNCKNPEAVIKLLDFCATNEGHELLVNGIEGIDWETDSEGKPVYIGETLEAVKVSENIAKETGIRKYAWALGLNTDPWNDEGEYYTDFKNNTDLGDVPIETDYLEHYQVETVQENFLKFPVYAYDYGYQSAITTEPGSEMDQISQAINSYVYSDVIQLIFAPTEEFAAGRDKAIEHIKALGEEQLVEYCAQLYSDHLQALEDILE